MSFAQKFITQLREGNTSDAIDTIKESLAEKSGALITEQSSELLASFGFIVEAKKEAYEEEDKDGKDKKVEEESEDDKSTDADKGDNSEE